MHCFIALILQANSCPERLSATASESIQQMNSLYTVVTDKIRFYVQFGNKYFGRDSVQFNIKNDNEAGLGITISSSGIPLVRLSIANRSPQLAKFSLAR